MTTATFNTEISVTYPYYSSEAKAYTETYNLNDVITVEGAVGPYTYNLLSTQDIRIENSTMALGPICFGDLIVEVIFDGGSTIATTKLQSGYAKMNEYLGSYLKQYKALNDGWSTYIDNRNKGI